MDFKPTKHYDDLRKVLDCYWHDKDFETLEDCRVHILLDILVWVGHAKGFYAAVRRTGELAIEQHQRAIRKLDEMAEELDVSQT